MPLKPDVIKKFTEVLEAAGLNIPEDLVEAFGSMSPEDFVDDENHRAYPR